MASGSEPLSYQWLKAGGGEISGATNSILALTNVQVADAGDYFVVVTNAFGAITSAVATLIVNRPPVAGDDYWDWSRSSGVKVLISNVLTNDSDPDSDPISWQGASAVSTNGGTVFTTGDWLVYQPPSLWVTQPDDFQYTIADNRGGQATGWIIINPPSEPVGSPMLNVAPPTNGAVAVWFNGIPLLPYRIQFSTNPPQWELFSTNIADEMGVIFFWVNPTNGMMFFRSLYP